MRMSSKKTSGSHSYSTLKTSGFSAHTQIINDEKEKDEKYKAVATNALKAMTNLLVEMENNDVPSRLIIDLCVLPILESAAEKYEKIDKNEDVDVDGFYDMVMRKWNFSEKRLK